jgi:hypothetical protein
LLAILSPLQINVYLPTIDLLLRELVISTAVRYRAYLPPGLERNIAGLIESQMIYAYQAYAIQKRMIPFALNDNRKSLLNQLYPNYFLLMELASIHDCIGGLVGRHGRFLQERVSPNEVLVTETTDITTCLINYANNLRIAAEVRTYILFGKNMDQISICELFIESITGSISVKSLQDRMIFSCLETMRAIVDHYSISTPTSYLYKLYGGKVQAFQFALDELKEEKQSLAVSIMLLCVEVYDIATHALSYRVGFNKFKVIVDRLTTLKASCLSLCQQGSDNVVLLKMQLRFMKIELCLTIVVQTPLISKKYGDYIPAEAIDTWLHPLNRLIELASQLPADIIQSVLEDIRMLDASTTQSCFSQNERSNLMLLDQFSSWLEILLEAAVLGIIVMCKRSIRNFQDIEVGHDFLVAFLKQFDWILKEGVQVIELFPLFKENLINKSVDKAFPWLSMPAVVTLVPNLVEDLSRARTHIQNASRQWVQETERIYEEQLHSGKWIQPTLSSQSLARLILK